VCSNYLTLHVDNSKQQQLGPIWPASIIYRRRVTKFLLDAHPVFLQLCVIAASPFHFIFDVKSVHQFKKNRQLSLSNPALFISLNRPRWHRTSNALRASISPIYRLDFLLIASIINSVKIRPTIDGIFPFVKPFCSLFWTDNTRFSFLDRWIFSTTYPTQLAMIMTTNVKIYFDKDNS
jgi:hypothetical protein